MCLEALLASYISLIHAYMLMLSWMASSGQPALEATSVRISNSGTPLTNAQGYLFNYERNLWRKLNNNWQYLIYIQNLHGGSNNYSFFSYPCASYQQIIVVGIRLSVSIQRWVQTAKTIYFVQYLCPIVEWVGKVIVLNVDRQCKKNNSEILQEMPSAKNKPLGKSTIKTSVIGL